MMSEMKSEHPVLTRLLAELSVGGGKVSGAIVREFVREFNIGLDRDLSPGTHALGPDVYVPPV